MQLGDSPDDARRRIEQLQQEQQQLLAQIRREIATLPPPDPRRENGTPQEREQDERRRQLLRLLAEIEKRVNEENARPKKRYISPATREEVYALYYDALRRRIACNHRAVERPDRYSGHPVRSIVPLVKGLIDAGLIGTKRTTALEDKHDLAKASRIETQWVSGCCIVHRLISNVVADQRLVRRLNAVGYGRAGRRVKEKPIVKRRSATLPAIRADAYVIESGTDSRIIIWGYDLCERSVSSSSSCALIIRAVRRGSPRTGARGAGRSARCSRPGVIRNGR
jgi:hypothetical protein